MLTLSILAVCDVDKDGIPGMLCDMDTRAPDFNIVAGAETDPAVLKITDDGSTTDAPDMPIGTNAEVTENTRG